MEYSLWSREAENGNIEACREHGMGFMAYSVLGRGFLAGLFHAPSDLPEGDNRRNSPRFQDEGMDKSHKLQAEIEALAREKSATPAQVCLAWALAQGPEIIPIPGAKTRAHLEDDLKALELELTPEDLARLNALSPDDGPRLPRGG
jgi:aryl-alcohol dehydrogenase-like predicted oxidoreductase